MASCVIDFPPCRHSVCLAGTQVAVWDVCPMFCFHFTPVQIKTNEPEAVSGESEPDARDERPSRCSVQASVRLHSTNTPTFNWADTGGCLPARSSVHHAKLFCQIQTNSDKLFSLCLRERERERALFRNCGHLSLCFNLTLKS